MIGDVTFTDSITLGSVIVAALVSVSILVGVLYGARWKTTAQVEAANAEAWEGTARRLDEELEKLREEVRALRSRIAELEALPDVAAVYAELRQHDDRSATAMREHDRNAEGRSQRLIAAIESLKPHIDAGGGGTE